jgi:cell division septation protein DedD
MASPRTLVETLIGVIPAEDGATLVARVGERARISSSAGSIDVGSVPLTAEVIDDLSAQLLAPEQLHTLRETGTVQVEFAAANGAGNFAMLVGSTGGDRWLELRRLIRPVAAVSSVVEPAAAPSEAAMATELLSRFHKESRARASSTSAAAAGRPAVAPPSAPPPIQPETAAIPSATATAAAPPIASAPIASPPFAAVPTEPPVTPTQLAVAPTEPVVVSAGSNPDLDVPTNIEFPDSNFDLDDLSVPSAILDQPLPSSPSMEQARAQAATPAIAAPQKRGARLSILLPAAAVLVIGLPAVSWFTWTQYFQTGQVKAAPAPVAMPHPKPAATAIQPPAPRPIAAAAPAAATQAPPPSAPPPVAAVAPPKATPAATAPAKPEPPAPPAKEKAVASIARHDVTTRNGFSVQVAAVHTRDEADRMAARLVQQGFSGYVVNGEGAAADYYRVRIGAFPDRQAAEDVAKRIELSEGIKPWIVKETR